jgi:hypothetical protein
MNIESTGVPSRVISGFLPAGHSLIVDSCLQGFHPVMIDTIRIVHNNPSPSVQRLVNGILQKGKVTYAIFEESGQIGRLSDG